MVKNFLLFLLFYVLALVESSFLVFDFVGAHYYLIFIALFLLVFLNSEQMRFPAVLFGGFFLDLFSGGIFGLKTLSLLLAILFLNFSLKSIRKKSILWFILLFNLTFLLYKFSFFLLESLSERAFTTLLLTPIELIYNLALATLLYGIFSLKKKT